MTDYYLSTTNLFDDQTIATDGMTTWGGEDYSTASETIEDTTNTSIATQVTSATGQTVLNGVKIYCTASTLLVATVEVRTDDEGDPHADEVANATIASVALVAGWNVIHFATAATISAETAYWVVVKVESGTGTLGGGAIGESTHTKYFEDAVGDAWEDSTEVDYLAAALLTDATGTAGEIAFTTDEFGHIEVGSDSTIRQATNPASGGGPVYVCDSYFKIENLGSAKAGVNAITITVDGSKNSLVASKNYLISCDIKLASPSVATSKGFNITTADLTTDITATYTATAADWTHIEAKLAGGADVVGTAVFSFTEMDGTFYIANISCRRIYADIPAGGGPTRINSLSTTELSDLLSSVKPYKFDYEVDNTTGPTYSIVFNGGFR